MTPHSLRRTYASLRAARRRGQNGQLQAGDDPVYIAEQLGHTDFAFTFRVYQKATKRGSALAAATSRSSIAR